MRFFITGSVQPIFFNRFIQDNAEKLDIKGFVRKMEDGRTEIFIEGNTDAVNQMASICRRGPHHSQIRKIDEKPERFQDFKDFKILRF